MITSFLKPYIHLMRLNKPIGIFLLAWPMLMALWIAGSGHPSLYIVFLFSVGAIVMRSAGCVANDILDRHFDKFVERTRHRPLATNALTVRQALYLLSLLLFIAFILVLQFNRLTIGLSFIALFLTLIYPLMKRYIQTPQLVLGLTFGCAVPMAFTAIQQQLPPVAIWLYAATAVWALIYDTEYAMVDKKDDLNIGLKSTAILLGRYDRLIIGLLQLVFIALLIQCGKRANLGVPYSIALIIASLLFLYQQFLIKDRVPSQCFNAFLNNHWVGFILWLGVFFAELF